MAPKVIGVIPARLGSTRLQEKVLKPINGKPMVEWVWRRASLAKHLSEVIIACDDVRIEDCVKNFGGKAMMTDPNHPNGSSRVAEVVSKTDAEIYINIQGDEPLINPSVIDQLADVLIREKELQVATLAVRKNDFEDYENPNVVKVVCAENGNALYFSRSPLPYYREKPAGGTAYLKHLGIYGYRRDFLLQFVTWKSGKLENFEKLEQLRILERGIPMRVIETEYDSLSVDTAADLAAVEARMKELSGKN